MRDLNSQPDTSLFRSFAAIIIILLLAFAFLGGNEQLSQNTEAIHVEQTVNEINSALAFVVYSLAVNDRLNRLDVVESQNPFYYLAINQRLPPNYHGEVRSAAGMRETGWYFDKSNALVIYHSNLKDYMFRLVFDYSDLNRSGQFESEADSVNSLQIKKAS